MAIISGDQVIGSCDQIKNLLGRSDVKSFPAVDLAKRDLPACQQSPEEHAGGFGAGQQALRLDAPLEFFVQALDGM